MPPPLAYFLTWSTYGTRLHGDVRGTVDRLHNTPGEPLLPTNPEQVDHLSDALTDPPFIMTPRQRTVVDRAIRDHCGVRIWSLLALNVRSTHVHVVVNCHATHSPELAMAQFKSWSTRRLTRSGLVVRHAKLWTHHGSTRWINHRTDLVEAIDYVENRQ